jgi:hypothetical protein
MLTRAEASGFRETSLHADVMRFVRGLESRGDPRLHVETFGVSPGGRELPLLVLSKDGITSPNDPRRAGRPVVLMLDGIHPGEVEGKEASLALVRDLLDGKHPDWLDALVLLVVPLFNPDGNDALDPANRRLDLKKLTGQPGPVVGTRTQSEGINLNRDYLRQAAPEMRLLQSRVCIPWRADLTIDNHATNGSVHRFDMTVDVPHTEESGRSEPIALMRDRVVPEVTAAVKARGFASGWYGNFVEDEQTLDQGSDADPAREVGLGWMTYPHHPRFGSNYRGLTNRLDLLLECYSYLPFEARVQTASAWQIETLDWVARHPDTVRQTVLAHDRPPERIAVRYRLDRRGTIDVPTRAPRTLDGEPVTVTIPHWSKFVGTVVIDRPPAYLVPPAVAEHLRRHGLAVAPAVGAHDVQIARITSSGTEGGRAILEAARVGHLSAEWRTEKRAAPEGWARVATDQPLGAIAVYLCEPESDDGAVENGLVPLPDSGEDYSIFRVVS